MREKRMSRIIRQAPGYASLPARGHGEEGIGLCWNLPQSSDRKRKFRVNFKQPVPNAGPLEAMRTREFAE
jgi:hypothetical protein